MNEILNVLIRLMAPVLSFTADEVWQIMERGDGESTSSVHERLFIPVKDEYRDNKLAEKWNEIIKVRREVTKALEIARKDNLIGHSLDASIILGAPPEVKKLLDPYRDQLRSLFIVSNVSLSPAEDVKEGFKAEDVKGLIVNVSPCGDPKCERCWIHDPTVGESVEHPTICRRCLNALMEMGYIK
jgi:isoleucyl-tRNA synthetase